MSDKETFGNLGDALAFLDKEREELEERQRLYHHHIREIMIQVLKQLDQPKKPKARSRG